MRLLLCTFVVLAPALAPVAASAETCSQRRAQCLAFCEKSYKAAGARCQSHCADALPVCMSTGCWKTPMANACGLTKG